MKQPVTIALIAAMSDTGVIGCHNQLPWQLPEELTYFRTMTRYKPVIMGRKTFESIGKPLPNRSNIVLSQQTLKVPLGVFCVDSKEAAIKKAKEFLASQTQSNLSEIKVSENTTSEIMVIGGSKIYELFLPDATRLYLSRIEGHYEGDAFFPSIDWTQWVLSQESQHRGFKTQIFERMNTARLA